VNRLREVVNDSADQPRFIETFPKRGYRFVAAIVVDGPAKPDKTLPDVTNLLPWWRSKPVLGIGGLIVFCMIVASGFHEWLGHTSTGVSRLPPVHKPVTFLGDALMPAISPDGTLVAYVAAPPEGKARLILQDLSGGHSLELLQAAGIRRPRWSPDGSELMVEVMENDPAKMGLFVVSRLGGSPRSLGATAVGRCWTPDGSQIVSATANHETDGGWIALVDKHTGR
jgi:hypothetical protein